MKRRLILCLIAVAMLSACEHTTYDEGDGQYSYMRADFALAHCAAKGELDYAVTDDGDSLLLSPHATASWTTKEDSVYRALLYYDIEGAPVVKPFAAVQVPVLSMRDKADVDTMFTDPVTLESAWLSRENRYLNLCLQLKTGVKEGIDARQIVGIVCDSVAKGEDGSEEWWLRLYHRQNGVPEYYSSKVYVSVPLTVGQGAKKVHLSVTDYTGEVERVFQY